MVEHRGDRRSRATKGAIMQKATDVNIIWDNTKRKWFLCFNTQHKIAFFSHGQMNAFAPSHTLISVAHDEAGCRGIKLPQSDEIGIIR